MIKIIEQMSILKVLFERVTCVRNSFLWNKYCLGYLVAKKYRKLKHILEPSLAGFQRLTVLHVLLRHFESVNLRL